MGLSDMTERELLIEQARDLKNLCKSFDDFKVSNEDDHKEIFEKTDNKVSSVLFRWVVGFVILFIVSLTGYTGAVHLEVVKNTTTISNMEGD